MYQIFKSMGLNIPEIYCVTDENNKIIYGDISNYKLAFNYNKVVAKSRYTHGGIGMELHHKVQELKPNYIYQKYVENNRKILEVQRNKYSSTVRIAIYNEKGKPDIIGAYIRFNSGTVADHATYGSICANIDLRNGIIISDGYDALGNEYKNHPLSNTKFKGFEVPNWQKCLRAVSIICENYSTLPLIGADIVVTENDYCLLEINAGFAVNELQKQNGLLTHNFVMSEYKIPEYLKNKYKISDTGYSQVLDN